MEITALRAKITTFSSALSFLWSNPITNSPILDINPMDKPYLRWPHRCPSPRLPQKLFTRRLDNLLIWSWVRCLRWALLGSIEGLQELAKLLRQDFRLKWKEERTHFRLLAIQCNKNRRLRSKIVKTHVLHSSSSKPMANHSSKRLFYPLFSTRIYPTEGKRALVIACRSTQTSTKTMKISSFSRDLDMSLEILLPAQQTCFSVQINCNLWSLATQ